MRARSTRFMAVSQAFLLLLTLVLPGLVAATEITTDLWVYQQGDTVNVTGIDFGPDEDVELVTTDPFGAETDRGIAHSDAEGRIAYSFVLNSDVPGIYDIVATGLTSGYTATTQFDPPGTPTSLRFVDSRAVDGNVTLTWGASSGNPDCYRIFRSSTSMGAKAVDGTQNSCTASASNLVTNVSGSTTTYTEARPAGAWFYYVTAVRNGTNAASGESASSNQVTTRDMEGSLPSSFGSVGVGSSSSGSTFTITNNSGGSIIVRAPTKSGTNQGDFAISGLTPAAGSTVANGGSFSFTVTFTPGAVGARSANIEVNVSDSGTPGATNTRIAPVSGTGADTTAPTVAAFSCVPAAGTTNDTSLDCSVTFSESVTGFVANSADLSITGSSTGWSAGTTTGSGAGPYTFTVSRGGSVDGSLGLQVAAGAAQDAAGNPSTASSTLSYTIDTAAPSVTAFTCTPAPGTVNNTSLSCSVTFSETVTGFVANSGDLTIGGSSTTWTAGATSGSGAGPYTFTVTRGAPGNSSGTLTLQVAAGAATDGANGTSASSILSYGIDTTVPNTPVISTPPANPTNSQSASFTFSTPADPTVNGVSSGINRLECQIDGGGFSTCTSPAAYAGLGAGSHTFQVRAVDNAGNTGTAASSTWVIDLTAPTVAAFACTPVGPSISVTLLNCSATFSESVTGFNPTTTDLTIGGTSTTWSAGSAAGSGAGPYTFSVSRGAPNSDGTLTLQIAAGAAADAAGNGSAASSVVTRTVDTTRPTATLSCTPLGVPTNATTIACVLMFDEAVTGFDPQTADLTIGGTSPSSDDWDPGIGTGSGSGPYNFTVVRTAPNKDGNLTFQIAAGAAQDSLGQLSLASNTLTYLIDTTEPTVAINSTPTNPTTSTSASFGFTATDPTNGSANGVNSGVASTQCQLDGSGFAACTSPAGYSGLGLGSHTFQVRAIDNGGNVGAPASFTWTIVAPDAAPTVVSTNPANGATDIALTGASIAITFSEPVNVAFISVSCASSGPHTYGKTGDGTSTVTFTLAGGEHYNSGELCTVTLTASLVTDVDTNDPPNAMAADYAFQFTAHVSNTAPVLTVPASPVIAEATSPAGAVVTFSVTATDAEDDPDPNPSCDPNSGDTFPIGDTTVNCSVTDSGGMSDSDSFTVRVRDTINPVVVISTTEVPDSGTGWFNIAANGDAIAGVKVDVAVTDAVGATSLSCTDDTGSGPVAVPGPLNPAGASFVLLDGEHDIDCTATDAAGHSGSDSESFDVDQAAPINVATALDRPADHNGWYNHAVGWTTTGEDATSGIDSCESDTYSGPDGTGLTVQGSCTDVAGNESADAVSDAFKYDATKPTASVTIDDVPNGAGWFKSTVHFTTHGTDNLSDIDSCGDAADYSGPDANPAASAAVTCTDNAGNVSDSATSPNFKYDATKPTASVTIDDSPNGAGWFNSTVHFTTHGLDNLSGVASCGDAADYSGPDANPATSAAVTCTDNAGNVSNSATSPNFKYDATKPVATVAIDDAPNGAGWFNSTVHFSTTGTDNLSGVVGCTDAADYSGPDSASATSASATCTDTAGNVSNPDVSDPFKYDATAPINVATALDRTADHNGWYNHAVGWTTTGDDDTSGIDSCETGTYSGPDGTGLTVQGSCTDVAGNESADAVSDAFKYDATKPVITNVGPTPASPNGSNGWYTTNVSNRFHVTDATSGLNAACLAVFPNPSNNQDKVTSGEGASVHTSSDSCTDVAGNTASAIDSANFKIDLFDPSISITSPASSYITVNSTITVSGGASDTAAGSAVSGVTVNGVVGAYNGMTSAYSVSNVPLSCGANTFTAIATENSGRTKQTTSAFTVTRVCVGGLQYYQPLDQSTTTTALINTGRFGKVIPVKVTATYNLGSGNVALTDAVLATNGLTMRIGVNGATCANGAPTDAVETFADAGSANGGTNLFRWSTSQWIYNLDTGNAPNGVPLTINSCYRLDVYLNDSVGGSVKISGTGGASGNYAIFKPTK